MKRETTIYFIVKKRADGAIYTSNEFYLDRDSAEAAVAASDENDSTYPTYFRERPIWADFAGKASA